MYTYQTGTRNGKQFVEGENLSISVAGSNDVTVTVSGLDIRDSYPVNRSTTGKDMMEYGWHVTLHGEDTYRIGTSSWAFDPGNTELLAQKHRLLGEAVQETKSRLETLKTAAGECGEEYSQGLSDQAARDALQYDLNQYLLLLYHRLLLFHKPYQELIINLHDLQ